MAFRGVLRVLGVLFFFWWHRGALFPFLGGVLGSLIK